MHDFHFIVTRGRTSWQEDFGVARARLEASWTAPMVSHTLVQTDGEDLNVTTLAGFIHLKTVQEPRLLDTFHVKHRNINREG